MEDVEFINKIFKIYAYVRNKDEANDNKNFSKDNIIIESCNTIYTLHVFIHHKYVNIISI